MLFAIAEDHENCNPSNNLRIGKQAIYPLAFTTTSTEMSGSLASLSTWTSMQS